MLSPHLDHIAERLFGMEGEANDSLSHSLIETIIIENGNPSLLAPTPGQIRLIQRGSRGRPVGAYLYEEMDESTWYCYITSQEVAYAGMGDVLLHCKRDGVRDPIANMVQTWNPVYIPTTKFGCEIGFLHPNRVHELADVGTNYLSDDLVRKGYTDPRIRYRELYRQVAQELCVKSNGSNDVA